VSHAFPVNRDAKWAIVDTLATVAILVVLIIRPSIWWWLLTWAWAALTYRQIRLAMRSRGDRNNDTGPRT
jgi:1,4-dihydroxy-2-naphthoate octaprenyltransferase